MIGKLNKGEHLTRRAILPVKRAASFYRTRVLRSDVDDYSFICFNRDNYRAGSKCITEAMCYLLSLRQRCPTTVSSAFDRKFYRFTCRATRIFFFFFSACLQPHQGFYSASP